MHGSEDWLYGTGRPIASVPVEKTKAVLSYDSKNRETAPLPVGINAREWSGMFQGLNIDMSEWKKNALEASAALGTIPAEDLLVSPVNVNPITDLILMIGAFDAKASGLKPKRYIIAAQI